MSKKVSKEEFKKRLYNKFKNNIILIDEFNGLNNYTNFKCNICGHNWKAKPRKILEIKNCPNCNKKNKTKSTDTFKKEIYDMYKDEYSLISEYKNSKTHVKIRHNKCGHEYDVTPINFLKGRKCPNCSNKLCDNDVDINIFKKEVYELEGDNYTVMDDSYINTKSHIRIRHNSKNCNYHINDKATRDNFLHGQRCPICSHRSYKKTTEEFINEVKNLPDGKDYKVIGEYTTNKAPIEMKCLNCGKHFYVAPVDFLKNNGIRCTHCKNSKAVKIIINYLERNNIKYETEVKFNDCKDKRSLPFDFKIILNKNKYFLLEYDGEHHFLPVYGKEKLKNTKLHDTIKNEYCMKNNIVLYRIDYNSFLNNELDENLNFIINEESSTTIETNKCKL